MSSKVYRYVRTCLEELAVLFPDSQQGLRCSSEHVGHPFPAPIHAIQKRASRSSTRKQEVIMLKEVPEMGLRKYQVAKVSPGAARNHLVPTGAAVYAHYLNKKKHALDIEKARLAVDVTPESELAIKEEHQRARLLKRLKSLTVAEDIKSDNNVFLQSYGVPQIARRILEMTNITVPHELFLLSEPYSQPGTHSLPMALLDDENNQITVTVQLTPRQASVTEVKQLGAEGS